MVSLLSPCALEVLEAVWILRAGCLLAVDHLLRLRGCPESMRRIVEAVVEAELACLWASAAVDYQLVSERVLS